MKINCSKLIALIGVILVLIMLGCSSQITTPSTNTAPTIPLVTGKEITVFAGSSSKAALDAAGKAFETKTGIKVYSNYGGSGTMLSQLELSKAGDIFIAASPVYTLKAAAKNIIYPDTEVKFYYLVPAILVQKDNPKNITSLADLAKPGLKIAIADPQTVPVGRYAYEILDSNKLLYDVGKNIIVYGESNEKISSYIILHSVDAAIAWDNIAVQQPDKLDVVYFQPNQVPRISFGSGAIATYTEDRDIAQKLLKYLTSTEGQLFFKRYGYYTTESEAKTFVSDAHVGGIYALPSDYKSLVE
ncbi:molybdate ABC transporter substrate-binding protein [Chloroflexota bacterium]